MEYQLVYDSTFKKRFGEHVKDRLDAIAVHVKRFFSHPSLDAKLNVVPVGKYIYAGDVKEIKGEDGEWDGGIK